MDLTGNRGDTGGAASSAGDGGILLRPPGMPPMGPPRADAASPSLTMDNPPGVTPKMMGLGAGASSTESGGQTPPLGQEAKGLLPDKSMSFGPQDVEDILLI